MTGSPGALPAFGPAVDVRPKDRARRSLTPKVCRWRSISPATPEVALDEHRPAGPAAQGLQADDAGAGEDVEERPAGDGVAEDAEQGLAHHLRGRTQAGTDGADEFAAPQGAGHDPKLHAHGLMTSR